MSIEKNIEQLAANTDAIRHLLKDMRTMLSHHQLKQVLMESQCDHIVGFNFSVNPGAGERGYLRRFSEQKKEFEIQKLFYFCPECGSKLR